jgi:transposase
MSESPEQQLARLRERLERLGVVTVSEAAKHVQRNPDTIKKWLQRGTLTRRGYDAAGRALVDLAEIQRLTLAPDKHDAVTEDGDDMLTASQAAKLFGLKINTISTWASRGYKNAAGQTVKLAAAELDDRGHKLYCHRDIVEAEKATRRRAGRDRNPNP